ncbi:MAG: winged helix-turn-helix protein [Cypionkella sp.]|uniref:winged helix-turn-helix domain-containing protein n=1 Tax=Cypionkella sp. TaxID=2811411 RepID=UPI002631A8B1|nr:crosslink repair DNA glycosylase YcaQ family protein [Cypionkella sp.]MDB5658846.1 winged helix-turn-helix protein [Cypionkella sp.]
MLPLLTNPAARRLFLHRHALAEAPTGAASGQALADLIHRIGFVQVDSINTVARAHHMILFSRRHSYKPAALKTLLERDRALFEHWTHDASILPVHLHGHWQHRFARSAETMRQNHHKWFPDGDASQLDTILRHIEDHGPVTTSDVGQNETRSKGGWWEWRPSKTALEWLWRTGQLAISGRDGFQKIYDLTERVIPAPHRTTAYDLAQMTDWACTSALDNLGFADATELRAYWNALKPDEAKAWVKTALASGEIIEIEVEGAKGQRRRSYARPDVLTQAANAPEPTTRLRILSPFDPALRDRNRTEFLFGFYYRIEVFVPEAKRQYGYYVFPVLEADRLIGRIDMKSYRDDRTLRVKAFWPEAGVRFGLGRIAKLEAELSRWASFTDCDRVALQDGWLREPLR